MSKNKKAAPPPLRSRLLTIAALAVALGISGLAVVHPALADGGGNTTDVTIQVSSEGGNIAWEAPTIVPMKATAAGTLIGPSADALSVRNLSAFPIRVKTMDVQAVDPFHLVADADKSSGENDFQMSVNGVAAAPSVELVDDGAWAMGYAGNADGTDTLPLTLSGAKIARVTADLSQAKKAATITWTVEPTTTIKPVPKPDPENGTVFAIDSDDAGTTKFYKRDRVPEAGEVFEGETLESDDIYTGSRMRNGLPQVWGNEFNHNASGNMRMIEAVDYGIKPSDIPNIGTCDKIYAIDFTKLDTRQTTSLDSFFSQIYSLASLDVSTWDTSNVTNMSYCFDECCKSSNPFSLDLSGWDTSNVTSMHCMFEDTPGLSVNGFGQWDTSSVTDMSGMFISSSAANRGIEGWDVSIVNTMNNMFGYSGYTEWDVNEGAYVPIYTSTDFRYLDLSSWDVSNVGDFGSMFTYTAAGGLDLSEWDVSKGENFTNMFAYCFNNYSTLDVSNWNISADNISTDEQSCLDKMFAYSNIGSVDASNWIFTGNGNSLNYLFYNSGIYTIDLSSWNVSSISYFDHMFEGCHNLTTVGNLSNWDISYAQSMVATFKDCPNLVLDCSSWKTDNHWLYDYLEDFSTGSPGVVPIPNPYSA